MPKFGSQIDTMRIPTKGLVPEQGTAFPVAPVEGLFFHRTDTKSFHIYLNGGWVQCDNQGVSGSAHIHAIADTTGLQAALDSKVPTTRTVTAGTGLTGGGDLTTNRSFAVNYGTAAGTALQGNTTLNQIAAPTADVNMNSRKILAVADPTLDTDAANKRYVDAARAGLDPKASVRLATTADILLQNNQTIDGVTTNNGDRILVKDQTNLTQNGIFVVNSTGAWLRATDANSSSNLTPGAFVFVEEGTLNRNSGWVLSAIGTVTPGTSNIAWAQFSGAGAIEAGDGLTKLGSQINVGPSAGRIVVNGDNVDIDPNYAGQTSINTLGTVTTGQWNASTIALDKGGTGATTRVGARTQLQAGGAAQVNHPALVAGSWSANILHNLGSTYVDVSFVEVANSEGIEIDWKVIDANNIQIRADVAFAANALRVSVYTAHV